MWLHLITLFVVLSTIVFLSLIIIQKNKQSSKKLDSFVSKICGNKYVLAQNKCLEGKPSITSGCFKKNNWATIAQQCIDKVDSDCKQNCRLEDCPAYLTAPIEQGCTECD